MALIAKVYVPWKRDQIIYHFQDNEVDVDDFWEVLLY